MCRCIYTLTNALTSRIINIYFSKMNYFRNYNYIHGVNDNVFVSCNRPTCIWTLFFWIIRDIVKVWAGVYDRTYLAIYMFMLHVPVPFLTH